MKTLEILFAVAIGPVCACGPIEDPAFVPVGGDVEVVADWDTPMFFADGYYWDWDGGDWYRHKELHGHRFRTREIPRSLQHVERPWTYSHYHAPMRASRPIFSTHANHVSIGHHGR
jgi:hypothetical protein